MKRWPVVLIGASLLVVLSASPAFAHGIGGRSDLPVPLSFFVIGAALALIISFMALSALWKEPRLQEGPLNRDISAKPVIWFYRVLFWLLPWLGGLGLALVILGGLIDGTASRNNIGPSLVWVGFWLVVPFASALLGDLWRQMSPWRRLGHWVNRDRPERHDLLERIGLWPATVAFIAFTWLELVSPNSGRPRTLATAAIIYTLYKLAITYWAGPETGLETGGAFSNYNRLLGSIAPIRARETSERVSVGAATTLERRVQTITYGGWLRSLPVIPVRRGLVAFVVALIGTVSYDGMSGTEWWNELFGSVALDEWFGTLALVGIVLIIGLGYYLASWWARRLASTDRSVVEIAARFAHTLVPIALAYAFAHYFTLIIFEGQLVVRTASDPFGLGWNLFGTADWGTVFWLSPTAIWYVQVAAIVCGHIAGVILAHDRALADFGERDGVRTQYAMLILMVALTSLGLFILAG